MVDYEFYVNYYLGSAIPENAFSGVAARARHYLTSSGGFTGWNHPDRRRKIWQFAQWQRSCGLDAIKI